MYVTYHEHICVYIYIYSYSVQSHVVSLPVVPGEIMIFVGNIPVVVALHTQQNPMFFSNEHFCWYLYQQILSNPTSGVLSPRFADSDLLRMLLIYT